VDVDGAADVGVRGARDHGDDRLVDKVAGVRASDVAAQDAVGGVFDDELHQSDGGPDRSGLGPPSNSCRPMTTS